MSIKWFSGKHTTLTRLVAVAAASVVVGMAVGIVLFHLWTKPMAPSLPTLVPTATQGPTATPSKPTTAATTPAATSAASAQLTPTPTPTPSAPTPTPMCGGPASMTILAVGTNRGFYDLADVIRVVRIDFVHGEVYVVPLPRDLKVTLPSQATTYPSPQKINEGYFLGTPVWDSKANSAGGAALLAQTLAYNFGISVDHYIVVSGQSFQDLVDAVGGVQVYLPAPVKDENQAHADFPAGAQTLDGYHAWLLARIRKNVGDLGRIQRQSMILKSLLQRLTHPSVLPQLPQLVKLYKRLVMTDLSAQDISYLLCFAQRVPNVADHVHFYKVPRDLLDEQLQPVYAGREKKPRDVLLWDERYKQWLHDALEGRVQP